MHRCVRQCIMHKRIKYVMANRLFISLDLKLCTGFTASKDEGNESQRSSAEKTVPSELCGGCTVVFNLYMAFPLKA